MTVKILLSGSKGRMGTAIKSIAEDHDCIISSAIDLGDNPENDVKGCDVIVDFSLRDATRLTC